MSGAEPSSGSKVSKNLNLCVPRVVVEELLRTLPMVDVEINNQNSLERSLCQDIFGGNGHIVKVTKATESFLHGVMP